MIRELENTLSVLNNFEKVAIEGLQCAYFLTNQYGQSKPLLVFLHEGLGSIAMWKDFPLLVADHLELDVLIYDRNGYGASDPLKEQRGADYLHKAAYEELPEVLNVLAPDRKVILWGHSDGGTIALLNAAINKNCLAVVTEAAHVFVEKETLEGITPAIQAFEAGKLKGLEKFHGEKTSTIFYAWAHTWLAPFFKNWNICEEIKNVKIPVLSIQGADDQYGTHRQLELIQESVAGHCEIIEIENCGHTPHKDQRDKVFELGANFLKKYATT